MVTSVVGKPTFRYVPKLISILNLLALSATMRLATEPRRVKLPA